MREGHPVPSIAFEQHVEGHDPAPAHDRQGLSPALPLAIVLEYGPNFHRLTSVADFYTMAS